MVEPKDTEEGTEQMIKKLDEHETLIADCRTATSLSNTAIIALQERCANNEAEIETLKVCLSFEIEAEA
jgi:hypothetical protein